MPPCSARTYRQLPEVMLAESAVRLRGLVEGEGTGDMHVERSGVDQAVELRDGLLVRHAVVSAQRHAGSCRRFRLDAVGIGGAPALTHRRERLLGRRATGGEQGGI